MPTDWITRAQVTFSLGFRPFFLAASCVGSGLMLAWLITLSQGYVWPGVSDPLAWHRHEMVFGYTGAVLAGFLLTAVRRWTGQATPDGWPLLALFIIWLVARLLPLILNAPFVYFLFDVLFWSGLGLSLFPALKTAAWRNRIFLVLVAGLGVAAALSHAGQLGWGGPWLGHLGAHLGLDLLLVVMVILANRVLPFFLQRGLNRTPFPEYSWLNQPLPWLLALLILVHLTLPLTPWAGLVNLLLAAVLLPRLLVWWDKRSWRQPLLWSLYLAYAGLILGLVLRGLGMFGWISPYLGIHALGIGGLGLLTLSMMSRVGLGHTGRPLQVTPAITLAFMSMLAAAGVRVLGVDALGLLAYQLAGGLWALALLIYFIGYWPLLTHSEVSSSSSRST